MKTMNWGNIASQTCPRCRAALATIDNEYKCSECSFHCDIARAEKILLHRGQNQHPDVRIKWQYLYDNLCPISLDPMEPMNPETRVHFCSNRDCRFRIKDSTLEEMKADPTHPINRFKR